MFEHKGYYVSFCDDVDPNKGGYYCEVYTDDWGGHEIDNFVITKEQLRVLQREEIAIEYIEGNLDEYHNISIEIIK